MKKWILLGVALAAIGGAGLYFHDNLEAFVASIIEERGEQVTGTRVEVAGLDLRLGEARASLAGLGVANPEGYGSGDAFSLGGISVGLDAGSIREGTLVLEEVVVQRPVVRVQLREDGSSNLRELQRRIESFSGPTAREGGGRPVRIARFRLEGGRIELDLSALGLEDRELDLPAVERRDVGGPGGAAPASVGQELLGAIAREALAAIARTELERQLRERAGEGLVDEAKGLLDKLGGG